MVSIFTPIPVDEEEENNQQVSEKQEFTPIALESEFTPIALESEVEPKATEQPDTYEGFLAEVGEGVVSGLMNIPSGIVQLGAELIDVAADTSYAKEVSDFTNELKDYMGIDPEGMAGHIAEGLIQFGIPGIGAASAVSKISTLGRVATKLSRGKNVGGFGKAAKYNKLTSLTKAQKVALGSQQMAAAGLADAIVATDGTQTIGDFFEGGPTTTDKYNVGDSGTEDAARRLSNRLSMFVEGGALAGALPPVLSGVSNAFIKTTTAKLPFVNTSIGGAIAAPINKITKTVGDKIADSKDKFLDSEKKPTTTEKIIARISSALSPGGLLPGAKTIKTAKKQVNKVFVIRNMEKGNKRITASELSSTEKTIEGNPKQKRLEFKTKEEAEQYLSDDALATAIQTDRWKAIDAKLHKLDSEIDASRMTDLHKEQRLLVQEELNILKNGLKIDPVYNKSTVSESIERIDIANEASLIKKAEGEFKGIERSIDKILSKPEYAKQTKYSKEKILNTMYEFFKGNEQVTKNINLKTPDITKFGEIGLPKELIKPLKRMVELKDGLSRDIINSSTVKNLPTIADFMGGKMKAPDSFIKKGYNATKEGSANEQWLELKRNQGFLIRDDVVNAIEDSLMKSDGTTSGFLTTRYRILEDSNYKIENDTIKEVVDMFFKEDVVQGLSSTVRLNMNKHVEKVFNQKSLPIKQRIAKAEREGIIPQKADVDEVAKLDYKGADQGAKPTKAQVEEYINLVFNNTKRHMLVQYRKWPNLKVLMVFTLLLEKLLMTT